MAHMASAVFASSVSNILGPVAGHPLDTIRVRMQLANCTDVTFMQVCRETVANEGVSMTIYILTSVSC